MLPVAVLMPPVSHHIANKMTAMSARRSQTVQRFGQHSCDTVIVQSRQSSPSILCPPANCLVGTELSKPREACGVFGVHAPGAPTASLTYLGLFALQHRGQESAGISASDGTTVTVVKDLGLVTQVFDERRLSPLQGHLAIGHVRYSTTGSTTWENSQPAYRHVGSCGFALAHNGNLTNTEALFAQTGTLFSTMPAAAAATTDSDVIAELLAGEHKHRPDDIQWLEHAVCAVAPRLTGAFTLVLMDNTRVIGVRDPLGFRPLCLGRLEQGWVLASETCALDIVGAHFVREVEPGEVIVLDAHGIHSHHPFDNVDPHLCVFEYVYFARPDSNLYGGNVQAARQRMGELLAQRAPVDADMVMPVPESGIPAAQGYAKASGIPYGDGLVKNRYVGRTFIAPTQELRDHGVRMKLNPLVDNIRGKRLVVIDDSIVRGSTTRKIVSLLREAGAKEVHTRISSPPYRWPCFFGMDTGRQSELLAANMSVGEIRDYVGADSLAYLDIDSLLESVGRDHGFCTACLTGNYPVAVDAPTAKDALESLYRS